MSVRVCVHTCVRAHVRVCHEKEPTDITDPWMMAYHDLAPCIHFCKRVLPSLAVKTRIDIVITNAFLLSPVEPRQ